jgi:NAD(P)-dependent dehydrogenase (short-subunit alcohol dehydrogenase family)
MDAQIMLMQDKVVMVAGVGPGMGRSIALASAREGADVVLAASGACGRVRRRRESTG